MKLKDLKLEFTSQLSKIYPSEEIDSFFTILSQCILKYSRLQVSLKREQPISEENIKKFEKARARLLKQEPIQYITGETEFYSLLFKVTKDTLVPRPETEELVDWMIEENQNTTIAPLHILDVGTGSGCIAIALAKNIEGAKVTAIDISEEALKIAKENAQSNRVLVDFKHLDILDAQQLPSTYNVIVSNPPYVRESEKELMQANVLQHEPASALFVNDENALVFYRKIAELSLQDLAKGGSLFFEINEYLGEEMIQLLDDLGFVNIEIKKDIFGKDRMIKCDKNG